MFINYSKTIAPAIIIIMIINFFYYLLLYHFTYLFCLSITVKITARCLKLKLMLKTGLKLIA